MAVAALLMMAFLLAFLPPSAFPQRVKVSPFGTNKQSGRQQLCVLENERSAIYLSMPENMPKGSILATLPIGGISSGQTANIRLSLVRGREFVRLNSLSKELVLKKAVDREQGVARIEAVVECIPLPTENNNNQLGGYFPLNITVLIAVTDVNDNPPRFPHGGEFHINLTEELPQGTPIRVDFGATDRDQPGPNSHIRYRIVQPSTPPKSGASAEEEDGEQDFSSLLAIPDPFRHELFVGGRIDFERLHTFSVLIEAEDQGSPRLRSVAKLDVNVLDVDDMNPVFSSPIYTARELRGPSHLAIEPGPIRAWDADLGFNETIIFGLLGEHSLNYAIDELTGAVKLLADQIVAANLVIVASQLNRPERNATAFLLIEPPLEREAAAAHGGDDQPREFYIQKIPANLAIGTELLSLEEGNGTAANFKLELANGQNRHPLSIDRATKTVRLARKLAAGEYEFAILAKPISRGRASSSSALRRIHLRLIVFKPAEWAHQLPEFEETKYEFELDWNSFGGEDGGTIDGAEFIPIGQIRVRKEEKEERRRGNGRSGEGGEEEREGSQNAENVKEVEEDEEQQQGMMFSLMDDGHGYFDIGMESGILRVRNPLQANSTSEKVPTTSRLFVMVEDSEGRRNFVECMVHLRNYYNNKDGGEDFSAGLSAIHLLGAACFLLLLANCATISLWLGRKKQFGSNLYDNLSYRYDSMDGKGRFGSGLDANKGGEGWMMNRALAGDPMVKITKTLSPPASIGRDFFSITTSFRPSEQKVAPLGGTTPAVGTFGRRPLDGIVPKG